MSDSTHSTSFVSQRENPKLAMWFFLGGEITFFVTLILTYAFIRLGQPDAYADFSRHLSVPIVGVNTFILIASSFMVVRSLDAISVDNRKGLRNNLIAVIVLGLLFLGGQAFEWITLFGEGVSIKDTFGTPFFTITGIHGTHVFVGVVWAVVVLISGIRGAYSKDDHRAVEMFGLYWHFVDIVWIVLFTLFYLI